MKHALVRAVVTTTLLACSLEARAAESSLAVGVGYVKAKGVDATVWLSGDFRFHLSKAFALAPEISYWKKSGSVLGVSASIEDLQFGVNAVAVLRPRRGLEVFGGGGGGLHSVSGSLAVRSVSIGSNSTTKGGLDVFGGIDIKAGDTLSLFLAARYDWVLGLGGQDPGRLDQTKFYGGLRLRF